MQQLQQSADLAEVCRFNTQSYLALSECEGSTNFSFPSGIGPDVLDGKQTKVKAFSVSAP